MHFKYLTGICIALCISTLSSTEGVTRQNDAEDVKVIPIQERRWGTTITDDNGKVDLQISKNGPADNVDLSSPLSAVTKPNSFIQSAAKYHRQNEFYHSIPVSPNRQLSAVALKSHGNATFVSNKTIFGAIIMSGYSNKEHVKKEKLESENTNTTVTAEKSRQKAAMTLSAIRSKNSRNMIAQLPFPVVHWPPVFSKACPHSASQHKSERGLLYAHYQIWLDFVYFDPVVLEKSKKGNVVGSYENPESGYDKHTFIAFENGTLHKYGSVYRKENIIVIFEDDADIAVVEIEKALRNEFNTMTTDLLFLGWCKGRYAKPVPLCAHAYAFTLEGARKAIKYIEPCGAALDEQFVKLAKNNWLTYREAHRINYENKSNSNYPVEHDGTFGIFHQKKMGSFNGH